MLSRKMRLIFGTGRPSSVAYGWSTLIRITEMGGDLKEYKIKVTSSVGREFSHN